jgi:methyl-accepting chemotaxis protein
VNGETQGLQRQEQREDGSFRARLAQSSAKYILWISGFVAILLAIIWVFLRHYTQLLVGAATILVVTIAAGLYPSLRRTGKSQTGLYLLFGACMIVLSAVPLLLPAIAPAMAMGYLLVLMLVHMVLGNRDSRWFAAVGIPSIAIALVLATTLAANWFPPLDSRLAIPLSASCAAIVLLVGVFIVRMAVAQQDDAFQQVQEANRAINEGASRERQQREYLQSTVQRYVEYETMVAQGNLQAQLTIEENGRGQDDRLVVLGNQLNATTRAMQTIIAQIRDAAGALTAQASEILATTTQQASGATEQSAAISQATTTVDEIKTIAGQLVNRSQTVADAAQRTVATSRTGQGTVSEAIAGMAQIKARVDVIEENILALSERTQQIGAIIDAVNDIASQSNMLALNAAVEAARAGEQGKGFAVVAQEVRDLAERSREATSQVKAILSDIQQATNATGMATEEGKKGVDAGVQLVGQMGEAINQLAGVIEQSAQSAIQMVAAGQQQSSGMDQIAMAMQNINQVTVQSMASAQQAERSAQELNQLASSLTDTVRQYQV